MADIPVGEILALTMFAATIFVVLIGILLVRPAGLLGRVERRKV